jgi:hypothetical protein
LIDKKYSTDPYFSNLVSPWTCPARRKLSWIEDRVNEGKHPDYNKSFDQLIESMGFEYQCHFVPTEDGHFLSIFRVNSGNGGRPIFL